MRHAEEIADLFARYTAEVGRYLPYRGRNDIEREIAATLADRLDDRVAASGRPTTVDDAVELLRETGHPRKTAASYLSGSHLIGPTLHPLFLLVSRIVLPVLAAVLIGALTLSAAIAADPTVGFLEHVLRILGSTVTGVLQAFALIVIVFAVLERASSRLDALPGLDTGWDPRLLPKPASAGTIKVSDQIAAIVGNTILISAVLFLPRVVVLGRGIAERMVVVASLSEGFRRLLPMVVAVAAVQIMAAIFLLTRRTHTMATIAAHPVVKALGIVAAGVYLTVWPFVLPAAGGAAGVAKGVEVLNQVIRVGCVLGIVFGSIEVARELVRFFRRSGPAA